MGKSKNKITNWPEYNCALTQRGSITFWVDGSAIEAWSCAKYHGRRGRGFQFSDVEIEMELMVKDVFFCHYAHYKASSNPFFLC